MEGSRTSERLGEEALEQHRTIRFYLGRLEAWLDAMDPGEDESGPLRDLVAQIESFKERLLEHHHSEESGLFQTIVDELPDAEAEVLRLTGEHEKMIEMLEMARIHAQNDRASDFAALRDDLRQFLEAIREHEHAEEALIELVLKSA